MVKTALFAACLMLSPLPALAQTDVCRDQNGNVDQAATQGWQGFVANANGQLMQQMIGTWYTEIPSPSTGQIAYRYITYEPSGLFTMQTRVCDQTGLCSDYPAHGAWAAQGGQGGQFTVMTIVSDTQVTNFCHLSQAIMPSPQYMQASDGQTWQRVQ